MKISGLPEPSVSATAGEESMTFDVCCGHPGASEPSEALIAYTFPSRAPKTIPDEASDRVRGAGEDWTIAAGAGRVRSHTRAGAAKAGAAR